MRILYELYNGKKIWLEVDEQVGVAYKEIVYVQEQRDRAETRRHGSYDDALAKGQEFGTDDDVEAQALLNIDKKQLVRAIKTLQPQQRKLLRSIFVEGYSVSSVTQQEDVHQATISHRLSRIYVKLKKSMK